VSESIDELMGQLTAKEIELLQLLVQGMNTSEISKLLSMSYHEVAEINQNIKRKLKVSSVKEMIKLKNYSNP
jgi:DNA-binding CsgD family transcriptional regulator